LVDDNQMFREAVAQRLRAAGHHVITVATGEQAFPSVRDWSGPVGWLYTRAALPCLVDGWILADAYHEVHAHRPAVISAMKTRRSERDIVLKQPTPAAVMRALLRAIEGERPSSAEVAPGEARLAA